MDFDNVVNDIKSLKIQGAENIAKKAVGALYHIIHKSKANSSEEFLKEINASVKKLIMARPTEPCLRNVLKYITNDLHKLDMVELIIRLDKNIKFVQTYFENAEKTIAEIGSKKIRNKTIVYTHCHSSTVMLILAKAKFNGRNFEVHNTETRPLFQGRITAKELAALGIKVSYYIDSAARLALKKADLVLFGADAIQSDGRIINKIGTELFLEIAKKYDIPSYCCAVSWKFDPMTIYGIDEPIENRAKHEVWDHPPKNVTIINPAFEIIDPELVTGIISELGIFKPEVFVDGVFRKYKWMI